MELKTNELRIGNFVGAKVMNIFFTIEGIKENQIFSSGNWRLIEAFEPIPLTEEWLLKFGFETRNGEWSKEECFEFIDNEFYYTAGEGCMMGKPIKYIHQLQNLYFALTNEELKLK